MSIRTKWADLTWLIEEGPINENIDGLVKSIVLAGQYASNTKLLAETVGQIALDIWDEE